jgi:hypothetical protein
MAFFFVVVWQFVTCQKWIFGTPKKEKNPTIILTQKSFVIKKKNIDSG